ncbi:hypothetical protein [Enterococcus sp.]|uniref:hypothetical protein n=1 Tax=Enterococcus sp. TaxID=35783 RepID=UPI003C70B535
MKKRIGIYTGVAFVYFILLELSGISRNTFDITIKGIPMTQQAMLPLLFIFFFQLIFCLAIFDYSRESFYERNLILLIRHRSRIRSFLRLTVENFIVIVSINSILLLMSSLMHRDFSFDCLPSFLMQTLGLLGIAVFQETIEIKSSSIIALGVVMITVMVLNSFNFIWIQTIHTIRFTGNYWITCGIQAILILVFITGGCLFVREQEII